MHDHLISLRGEVLDHTTILTPPLCIEVPVPSQETERSCISVLEVMYLCAKGIEFASFYDFAIGCWNCLDSVVF